MRRKPPDLSAPRRERERRVTAEEAALWHHVTATIDAQGKMKPRVRDKATLPDVAAQGGAAEKAVHRHVAEMHAHRPVISQPEIKHPPHPVAVPKPKVPQLAEFERRKVRHIASGKIEIDARVDLHGLRQGEARHRLIGFLRGAHERGHRTVLVITGKGSSAAVDPLAHALGEPQRGVLRRLVPQWLEEPECRALVISFTTATQRHGGDGALYVRLRRGDR